MQNVARLQELELQELGQRGVRLAAAEDGAHEVLARVSQPLVQMLERAVRFTQVATGARAQHPVHVLRVRLVAHLQTRMT